VTYAADLAVCSGTSWRVERACAASPQTNSARSPRLLRSSIVASLKCADEAERRWKAQRSIPVWVNECNRDVSPTTGKCFSGSPKTRTIAPNRWQHRRKRERPTCTERNQSLLESADGSMATVVTRQGKNLCPAKSKPMRLTQTGLLMEGVIASLRVLFAKIGVNSSIRWGLAVRISIRSGLEGRLAPHPAAGHSPAGQQPPTIFPDSSVNE